MIKIFRKESKMDNSGKHCYRCKNFIAYYTKGEKRFNKIKIGWCGKRLEEVNLHFNCDKYSPKGYSSKPGYMISYYLDNLLSEITAIRQVIEEEKNEYEQNAKMQSMRCLQTNI